jgi:outer membrane protein assembly factor BamB
VEKDLGSAYAWINVAMANGLGSHQRLRGLKDIVANELSPEYRLGGTREEVLKARAHANHMIRKNPNLLRVQIARPAGVKASKPGTVIWKFAIGGESDDSELSISSPALGSDGAIYFGANNGNVYSLESDTGQICWVFNVAEYSDLNARGILPRSTIGSDGTVYLTGERDVFALDGKTGEVKWKFGRDLRGTDPGFLYPPPGGSYVGSFINRAPAIGADGTIYLQANRHGAQGTLGIPQVIALHPVTGKKIWESGGHDYNF